MHLIELIEVEAARLSPEGRGLWEELEFLLESTPDEEDRMAREYEISEHVFGRPSPEQGAIARLAELLKGLREGDEAESRGESGEEGRACGVVRAAWLKDLEEGCPVDRNMAPDRAIARLEGRR